VRQTRQADIIPTSIGQAGPIARVELVDGAREVLPGEVLHDDGRVIGAAGNGAGL